MEIKQFERRRLIKENLLPFGFQKKEGGYLYTETIMDGAFTAVITIDETGRADGDVMDTATGEPYVPFRVSAGAFASDVRSAYEAILSRMADACFETVPFASDTANRIARQIEETYHVRPDFPWKKGVYKTYGVFRHKKGKWFALIMDISKSTLGAADKTKIDVLNVKINPADAGKFQSLPGIYPGYHMNHNQWITIALDGTVPDDFIMERIAASFELTKK